MLYWLFCIFIEMLVADILCQVYFMYSRVGFVGSGLCSGEFK